MSILIVENFTDTQPRVLEDQLEDGKIEGIEGEYLLSDDAKVVSFHPKSNLTSGKSYGVIVTRNIHTDDGLALPIIYIVKFDVENSSSNAELATNLPTADDDVEEQDLSQEELPADDEIPVELFINELYYDAVGSDTDGNLFIELYGTPGGDISKYQIVFINGDDGKITETVTLPSGTILPADGYYVIADAKTGSSNSTNVAKYNYIANFDPQNGPDAAQLLDSNGKLIDAVCYGNVAVKTAENGLSMCEGSPAPDAASGKSITRTDVLDTDDNSADFTVSETLTPGE